MRVVERKVSALCSCFWGGGKRGVAELSWETLNTKCTVPCEAAEHRRDIHKHMARKWWDLRGPVWCLHVL